ncbi:PHP domain-containing protein [Limnochorda pilosa]|uniref:PHP domain-containing protein n=1 Tax=Limnochorda pilosa TaxID=1555112 RepID=UPI000830624A|nr:PHP domain-containing protein [Limnochorda pilosa]
MSDGSASEWILQRDMHVHSGYSDGEDDFEAIIARAVDIGVRRLAVTDHFEIGRPNSVRVPPDQYLHAFRQAQDLAARKGVDLLLGVETGVAGGRLLCPDQVLAAADLVVASVHEIRPGECGFSPADLADLPEEEYWACYQRQVLQAARAEFVDVLGHVEGYLPARWSRYPGALDFAGRRRAEAEIVRRFFPLSFYRELAAILRIRGVAVELHGMSCSPRLEVARILREEGCTFSIGSDAHALHDLGHVGHAARVAGVLGLGPRDFHPLCR